MPPALVPSWVGFGLGQCIGPVLSGLLADGPSGVRAGLWVSVSILIVGALIAAAQPEPASPTARAR